MDIQLEKIELIRQITEIDSESLLTKLKTVISGAKVKKNSDSSLSAAMAKRLDESIKQAAKGKVVKVKLDDIWK